MWSGGGVTIFSIDFEKSLTCAVKFLYQLEFYMRRKNNYLLFSILLLSYFPLFLHLDTVPLMIWDESRLAVSAFEMLHNKNLVVVTLW